MKKTLTTAAVAGLVLLMSGCSGFRSVPTEKQETAIGTKTTYAYLDPQSRDGHSVSNYYLDAYDALGADKKQVRNQITDELLSLVDDDFEAFTRHLRTDRAYKNVFVKVVSIAVTGAAPFSSGPVAKVLGGIDTGIKGISETVDVEAWGNQAPAILIDTMRAERANVLKEINLMRDKPVEEYTLQAAIKDVGRYRSAGFVTTALSALARQTSQTAANKEAEASDAKVFPKEVKEELVLQAKARAAKAK